MKRLLPLLALTIALPTLAATANLSYQRPTQYADGTALPQGDIASYNVRCVSFTPTGSTAPGTCPAIAPTTLPGAATGGAITLTLPAAGGRACFQVQTVAVSGTVSAWSAEGCKTFAPAVPNPPSNVTVTATVDLSELFRLS